MPNKKPVKNAGAKGGKFYINSKGNVVYGVKSQGKIKDHKDEEHEKKQYDPKKEFKEQFPSYDEFKAHAEKVGVEVSEKEYKQLYQKEHKTYMNSIKEAKDNGEEIKGLGDKKDFLNTHVKFNEETGEFIGKKWKEVEEQAKAEGVELSKDEFMKHYKQEKYAETKWKKANEGKPKPEPKKEPEKAPEKPKEKKAPEKEKEPEKEPEETPETFLKGIAKTKLDKFKGNVPEKGWGESATDNYNKAMEYGLPHEMALKYKALMALQSNISTEKYKEKATELMNEFNDWKNNKKPETKKEPEKSKEEKVPEKEENPSVFKEGSLTEFDHSKFPKLDGTYKQSKWAWSIRGQFMKQSTEALNIEMPDSYKEVLGGMVSKMMQNTDSKHWIDNKETSLEEMLKPHAKSNDEKQVLEAVFAKKPEKEKAPEKEPEKTPEKEPEKTPEPEKEKEPEKPKLSSEEISSKAKEYIDNNPPVWDKDLKGMNHEPHSQDKTGLEDEVHEKYTKMMANQKAKYEKTLAMNSADIVAKTNENTIKTAEALADMEKLPQTVKLPYGSVSELQKHMVFQSDADSVGKALGGKLPFNHMGKTIYWQHNPSSTKWEAGTLVGYDESKKEYIIKCKSGKDGSEFYKSRPADAIRIPVKETTIYPKADAPKVDLTDGKAPSMDSKEAKEYFKEAFEKHGLDLMKNGVAVNHDSTIFEGLEVRVRYNVPENSYQMEFKLRDKSVKDEIYDNMKKTGKLEQKVWKGTSQSGEKKIYEVSNFSVVNNDNVNGKDVKFEYLGAKTTPKNVKGYSTSLNEDSGWAIKDTVAINIPLGQVKDAGEAYEVAMESLKKYTSPETHQKMFSKSEDDSVELVKKMSVLNYLSPKFATGSGAYTGEFSKLDSKAVDKEIKKLSKKLGTTNLMDKVDYIETSKGHSSVIIKDYHKELEQAGMKQIFTGFGCGGEDGVNIAMSVLKNGGLSLVERHKTGFINGASSGHQDYSSGGANYLFTRMINESNYNSGYSGYQSSGIKVVWKNEVMDRTDVCLHNGDAFGSTLPESHSPESKLLIAPDSGQMMNSGSFQKRKTALEQAKADLKTDNEVDFKNGISPKYISHIVIPMESEMSYMYEKFKQEGLINAPHPDGSGKLLSDCVVMLDKLSPSGKVKMTLTDYINKHK